MINNNFLILDLTSLVGWYKQTAQGQRKRYENVTENLSSIGQDVQDK